MDTAYRRADSAVLGTITWPARRVPAPRAGRSAPSRRESQVKDGRATGGERSVLFAARSQNALHRLLDTLPVFAGDDRVHRCFTLVPGSAFSLDALAAIDRAGGRTLPWTTAVERTFDLILAASPKGDLHALHGPRVLLPHGAGFNKSVPGEGTEDSASGLDPAHLLRPDGAPLATRYLFSHPSQIARLAPSSPAVAARSTVVGDPLMERFLESQDRRDRYRAALRTGARTLVVLLSTWGPESLIGRRPGLPAELAAAFPHDEYQLALVLHPNERARRGALDLAEYLDPARQAGLILPAVHEEWASVAIAADLLITDHGSAALYPAALDRPLLGAYDGGGELLPGSPMSALLTDVPRLSPHLPGPDAASRLATALLAHRPGSSRALAEPAFAEQGQALDRLRETLYDLLDLTPSGRPVLPRLLPDPAPAPLTPAAFAVRVEYDGHGTPRVLRHPAHLVPPAPAHHLSAEVGAAHRRFTQSAALLHRHAGDRQGAWTEPAGEWTLRTLADHPGGRRTAAIVLSPTHCLLRPRSGPLLSVRLGPGDGGRRPAPVDPVAVLSAVHAALLTGRAAPGTRLVCAVGPHRVTAHLTRADPEESALPV
ncbi:translation initiation factor 2 [Streptomyces sp. WP-1]|uniref:translation initiation factor 2 n=1 Tax=Streptomyces sp. WP-1 TaxID=3041497 RepID=UPI00264951B2|nr:translation initiation factor 2 [Streptomyces sp. WP-1]WKE72740.1 translation initiation factor 2 [Streptomyces sp. WP-1]